MTGRETQQLVKFVTKSPLFLSEAPFSQIKIGTYFFRRYLDSYLKTYFVIQKKIDINKVDSMIDFKVRGQNCKTVMNREIVYYLDSEVITLILL